MRMANAGQFAGAALGRPIATRCSPRNTTVMMLQALELVNGERLAKWLLRGARNMLGELPRPPAALFVAPINARGSRTGAPPPPRSGPAPFESTCLWCDTAVAGRAGCQFDAVDKAEAVWAAVNSSGKRCGDSTHRPHAAR